MTEKISGINKCLAELRYITGIQMNGEDGMVERNYGTLKLDSATAERAVKCMTDDGLLPDPTTEHGMTWHQTASSEVTIGEDGSVSVSQHSDHDTNIESNMVPAGAGHPAAAATIQAQVTGPAAEKMREKAIACAYKSIGIAP